MSVEQPALIVKIKNMPFDPGIYSAVEKAAAELGFMRPNLYIEFSVHHTTTRGQAIGKPECELQGRGMWVTLKKLDELKTVLDALISN